MVTINTRAVKKKSFENVDNRQELKSWYIFYLNPSGSFGDLPIICQWIFQLIILQICATNVFKKKKNNNKKQDIIFVLTIPKLSVNLVLTGQAALEII